MMKKWIALTIAALMLVTSIPMGFAASLFTDVPQNQWSYASIKSVSEKGIMPGFGDASYKPSQKVTKVEVVLTAYRAMKAANKLGTFSPVETVKKYKDILSKNSIPAILSPYGSDVYTAFGYALENKILVSDDLKTIMSAGKPAEANKQDISVILGKTLNLVKQTNVLNKIISFSYKDASEISNASAPYVYFLIENKILNKSGDNNGKFNPKASVTREVMATMLLPLYNAMAAGGGTTVVPVVPTTPTTPVTPTTPNTGTTTKPVDVTTSGSSTVPSDGKIVGTGTVSGKIVLIHVDKLLIEVKDNIGKTNIYDVTGAQIYKDNTLIGLMNLEVGQNIILSVANSKVTKIIVEKNYVLTEGTFVEISKEIEDTKNKTKFRVITIEKANKAKEYFKVDGTVFVELDRVSKNVDALTKNDKVTISSDSLLYARKIEGYTARSEFLGTIIKMTDFKAGSDISIKMPDGRLLEQKFKSDIETLKISNKDIRRMDIVKVILVYGEIKRVESTGMVAEDFGTIKEVLISDTASKLTILNKQGERKTYNFGTKYDLLLGAVKAANGLYDLRIGQDVSLEMDPLGIYSMVVNEVKTVEKEKLILTLSEVVKGTNFIKGFDESGKVWVVNLKENAMSATEFKIGDKILITGTKLAELIFEAETVVKNN